MQPLLKDWLGDKAKNLQVKINKIRYQRMNSNNCGYFAMKFLIDRYQGKHFKEITGFNDFANILESEEQIKKFKKKIKPFILYNKYINE